MNILEKTFEIGCFVATIENLDENIEDLIGANYCTKGLMADISIVQKTVSNRRICVGAKMTFSVPISDIFTINTNSINFENYLGEPIVLQNKIIENNLDKWLFNHLSIQGFSMLAKIDYIPNLNSNGKFIYPRLNLVSIVENKLISQFTKQESGAAKCEIELDFNFHKNMQEMKYFDYLCFMEMKLLHNGEIIIVEKYE
jgi:hypothetical protein